jgi:hypothetical protein
LPRLASLEELTLTDERIGDEGARSLAESPHAGGLRELSLNGCDVGDEGARALAESPHLGRLRELCLYRSGLHLSEIGLARQALRQRFGDRVRLG